MLTFLAALAVLAPVAAFAIAPALAGRRPIRAYGYLASVRLIGRRSPNPWPAAPAVAAGPRLFDRERVPA